MINDEIKNEEVINFNNLKEYEKNVKKQGRTNPELCYALGKFYIEQSKLNAKFAPKAMRWLEQGLDYGLEKCVELLLEIDDLKCCTILSKKYGDKHPEFYHKTGHLYTKHTNWKKRSMCFVYWWKGCQIKDADCIYAYAMEVGKTDKRRKEEMLTDAAMLGHEGAKEELHRLNKVKKSANEKTNSKSSVHSKSFYTLQTVYSSELFGIWIAKESMSNKFRREHILVRCPACQGNISVENTQTRGKTYNEYVSVYDKGTSHERVSAPFNIYTNDGQTCETIYKCQQCGYKFKTTINTILKEVDKNSFTNMIKSYDREQELHTRITIKHETVSLCDAGIKSILRRASGKYDGKA